MAREKLVFGHFYETLHCFFTNINVLLSYYPYYPQAPFLDQCYSERCSMAPVLYGSLDVENPEVPVYLTTTTD